MVRASKGYLRGSRVTMKRYGKGNTTWRYINANSKEIKAPKEGNLQEGELGFREQSLRAFAGLSWEEGFHAQVVEGS